jgi:pSer/pThr/pTyr-binding forkhead associated (FHA) protein
MDILLLALRLLLALLLYAFLAAVLAMLWRDLRQTVASRQAARPGGQLVVLDTADDALAVGTTFRLQPVTSIGRSPANTVPVSDTYASAQHTLVTWREGQWWLEDRGSRNGTFLNDTRVSGPTVVSAGDVIGVGRIKLKLELD